MRPLKTVLAVVFLLPLNGCFPELFPPPNSSRLAQPPAAFEDDVAVYFSPTGGAMAALVSQINGAKRSIDVQAYLITAKQVVEALQAAQNRGVYVRIVLDKNNSGGIYSMVAYLSKTTLPVWRDGRHKDQHNKIMLIDGRIIITGSFNFTDPSEDQNAENLLIIRDKPTLYAAYEADFETHLAHSDPPR
jgi:phosphatidylserine/phosphatidylglycerophosphate/cardiolipin synthase-like enzyme